MPILHGTLLQPRSAGQCDVTAGAAIVVGDDGRIEAIARQAGGGGQVLGDKDCWILPGFIDAHLHIPQWDRRGIDGLSLGQWQEQIGFPAEARLADPKLAEGLAEQFATGMIAHGTTTLAAFGSPFAAEVEATFGVLARRGLRAVYGMSLNDTDVPAELRQETDKALDDSRQLAARWHGAEDGRLHYAFSPRGSIRCSEKLLRGVGALAEMLQCYIQTHIAETLEELAEVHQRFAEQVDEVDLFADLGVLGPRTLLAHGVFLSHAQRREVAQRRAALVHCPTANLFRESGLMDYMAHRAAGIRIALGSSIAGGFEPFMPRVAVEGLQTAKAIKVHTIPRSLHPVPTPAEAWWMLTAGAAEALGMGDRIGSIQKGFQADLLVVRPERWINDLPPVQQVSALLYTLSPRQIEHVLVAGRRIGPGSVA